jgi:hypothetical protein
MILEIIDWTLMLREPLALVKCVPSPERGQSAYW